MRHIFVAHGVVINR